MAGSIKIAILADEKDFTTGMGRAESSMKDAEATAERTGRSIEDHLSGSAEGADTLASKGSQAAGALAGIGEVVGTKFPAVGAAMTGAGAAMQFAADSGDLLNVAIEGGQKLWASAVGGLGKLAGALKLQKIATVASTVAQRALNLAVSMNPIGLIILAIIALVAIFVIAYKKSDTFRAIVNKVGAAVKTAARWVMAHFIPALKAIISWIGNHVVPVIKTLIRYFGPGMLINAIRQVIAWFKNHLIPAVSSVVSAVRSKVAAINARFGAIVDKVRSVVSGVRDKFGSLIGWIGGLPGRIARITSNMFHGITDAFRRAINVMVSGWNRIHFSVPSIHIPGLPSIGGFTIGVPQIPFLANGGIVTGPTLAVVGEAGPEAVVPLDGRIGGNTYNLNVSVTRDMSPAQVGRGIVEAIRAHEDTTGRKVLAR
ncbi:MAG TPA: hypothetical protein VFH70_07735 [Acidimicrobiales bacterium]|nr:hypothetical protein [Acidimicrobiales bacterium]